MNACSRYLSRALRTSLVVVVLSGLTLATGCSWFKHKPPPVTAIATPPTDVNPIQQPAQATTTMPADNRPESPRPGDILPLPEMKVVYFDYDKSDLRPDQMENLESNLAYLRSHPEIKAMVEGHCDERGSVEYNYSLGERRAQAVRDYFVKNGIPVDRVTATSKGKEQPADPGHNEAAWAKNRRCEFKRVI